MSNEREDIEMNIKKLRELKKNKKGFTLIEIIVVIVILAVLMAVAVPSVLKYLNEADNAKYISQARAVMQSAQTEVIKAYAPDSKLSSDEVTDIPENVVAALKEDKVEVSSVFVYTTAPTVKKDGDELSVSGGAVISDKSAPADIVAYSCKIKDGSKSITAYIVPNGSIQVGTTVSSDAAPTPAA